MWPNTPSFQTTGVMEQFFPFHVPHMCYSIMWTPVHCVVLQTCCGWMLFKWATIDNVLLLEPLAPMKTQKQNLAAGIAASTALLLVLAFTSALLLIATATPRC